MNSPAESTARGRVIGVNGNLVTVDASHRVNQNESVHVQVGETRLLGEVLRVRGRYADVQLFEDTQGLRVGMPVEFRGEMISVELGPGLLGRVYDGLQNPLNDLAEQCGFFLERGVYLDALDRERQWRFQPEAKQDAMLRAGDCLGTVEEGLFRHRIMVPFGLRGEARLIELAEEGEYTVDQRIARLETAAGEREVRMYQHWPAKRPIACYEERLRPDTQLITKQRILDTVFPVAKGGAYCIPGPFGAGKTVLQQLTSRHADVDIVIIAACGERAGEVVETLREFPKLEDPRTGRSLMERTIIICNTSSMPVAARESSVYTAVTTAEYYRQMGLDVLLLADSTSRWAQALREMSGRLEEIPGEEAYPAYLESLIAAFYERAGRVRLRDGSTGSVTIGGTVSPSGGDFEEPVTQATLKVVGAFHGLSRARSDARRYPAIDPIESWSRYPGLIDPGETQFLLRLLRKGHEVEEMMKVVEEAGTPTEDFIAYLKSEFLDNAYLQQDSFDPVEGATDAERQRHVFDFVREVLRADIHIEDKTRARRFFQKLTQRTRDWNRTPEDDEEYGQIEKELRRMLEEERQDA